MISCAYQTEIRPIAVVSLSDCSTTASALRKASSSVGTELRTQAGGEQFGGRRANHRIARSKGRMPWRPAPAHTRAPRRAAAASALFSLLVAAAWGSSIASDPFYPCSDLSLGGAWHDDGFTFALVGGVLHGWGDQNFGQLGRGYNVTTSVGGNAGETGLAAFPAMDMGTDVSVLAVSAGWTHACALLTPGGRIKCWGFGGAVLGDGQSSQMSLLSANLPTVDLGTGLTASQVACHFGHSCALLAGDDAASEWPLNAGIVKCWGKNDRGQLGQGDQNDRGDEAGEMGDFLPAVSLGARAMAVAVGGPINADVSCALLEDGRVRCWGGGSGIGGAGATMGDALAFIDFGAGRTAVALSHSCAILDNGALACWSDAGAQTAVVQNLGTGRMVVAVADGEHHRCAILDNRETKCWGEGRDGALG